MIRLIPHRAIHALKPAVLACWSLGFFALGASGATISLGNDFSITNGNPNGNWSYQVNSTNLTLQTPTANGNALIPALATGFWGAGPDLNADTPEVFQALVDGSAAGSSSTLDFLTGDIIVHSPNASGSTIFMRWTAPTAGTINSYNGAVWYAHSSVNPARSNDFVLMLNASGLASGTVTSTNNRSNQSTFSGGPFAINAGDVISLGVAKTAGQSFGSLAGLSLSFDFTPDTAPTPEPSTYVMLSAGLAALGLVRRRAAQQ